MGPKPVRIFQVVRIHILTRIQYPHQKTGKIVLKMAPVRVVRVVRIFFIPFREKDLIKLNSKHGFPFRF
jgi:hypothetical protein